MKRQSSTGDGPAKRAMLDGEAVLRHQNRQLASALKLAKNELAASQTRLSKLETDRDLFDATTSSLDRAWKLLNADLSSVAHTLGLKIPSISNSSNTNGSSDALPSSSRLIQSLADASDKYVLADATKMTVEGNGVDEDDEPDDEEEHATFNLDQVLKDRIHWTTSLLSQLLTAVASRENGVNAEGELHAQIRGLTARVHLLAARLVSSRKKIKELRTALETAKGEVWRLTRRLDSLEQEGPRTNPPPIASSSSGASELPQPVEEQQHPTIERPSSSMSRASSAINESVPSVTPEQDAKRPADDAELKASLEEMKELASSRLAELEQVRQELRTALSNQAMLLTSSEAAAKGPSSTPNDLLRDLDRERQHNTLLMKQADRANAVSRSALLRLQEAEARIEQLESAADAIVKATDAALSKENARLKQALEETKKQLDERSAELDKFKTLATVSEEKDKMIKGLTEERNSLKSKLDQQREKGGAAEESEALIMEIESINNALNESRDSCSRLQQVISEREQRLAHLQGEKGAMESDLREIREEKNALALRSEKVQAMLHENEAYVARLEERLMSEKSASQKAEEMARLNVEQCEKAMLEVEELKREAETQKERLATIPELEEEIRATRLQVEDTKWDLNRSEEEVKTLKRRLDRAKAALEAAARAAASSGPRGPAMAKSIDEERLEAMTHALRCPVYQHLWKDCVITKCAHMFSRKALEDNLAQRNRKCPSCKNTYSKDDILNVYLYQSNDV